MPDLAIEDKEDLRAFLENKDTRFPELADLPFWWEQTPPDARAPDLPRYLERDILVICYSNWAFTKQWAWEGLQRLLNTLIERREPIPEILRSVWSDPFAAGRRKPPSQRGRPDEAERNARIMQALRVLQREGSTQEEAMHKIADALHLEYETARSAVRKVRNDRPFR